MEPSIFKVGQQVRFTNDAKEGDYSDARYKGTFLVCNASDAHNLRLNFGLLHIDEKHLEQCEFKAGQRVFFTRVAQATLHNVRGTFTVECIAGTWKGYQMLKLTGREGSAQASLLEPVT